MAIRHVVTIQVASGRGAEFVNAFKALQAITLPEQGCEQYELFQCVDEPDKMVLLERWAGPESLERHRAAERTQYAALIGALVALWAPGTSPTVERFDT